MDEEISLELRKLTPEAAEPNLVPTPLRRKVLDELIQHAFKANRTPIKNNMEPLSWDKVAEHVLAAEVDAMKHSNGKEVAYLKILDYRVKMIKTKWHIIVHRIQAREKEEGPSNADTPAPPTPAAEFQGSETPNTLTPQTSLLLENKSPPRAREPCVPLSLERADEPKGDPSEPVTFTFTFPPPPFQLTKFDANMTLPIAEDFRPDRALTSLAKTYCIPTHSHFHLPRSTTFDPYLNPQPLPLGVIGLLALLPMARDLSITENINTLPTEVVSLIYHHAEDASIFALRRTCKRLYKDSVFTFHQRFAPKFASSGFTITRYDTAALLRLTSVPEFRDRLKRIVLYTDRLYPGFEKYSPRQYFSMVQWNEQVAIGREQEAFEKSGDALNALLAIFNNLQNAKSLTEIAIGPCIAFKERHSWNLDREEYLNGFEGRVGSKYLPMTVRIEDSDAPGVDTVFGIILAAMNEASFKRKIFTIALPIARPGKTTFLDPNNWLFNTLKASCFRSLSIQNCHERALAQTAPQTLITEHYRHFTRHQEAILGLRDVEHISFNTQTHHALDTDKLQYVFCNIFFYTFSQTQRYQLKSLSLIDLHAHQATLVSALKNCGRTVRALTLKDIILNGGSWKPVLKVLTQVNFVLDSLEIDNLLQWAREQLYQQPSGPYPLMRRVKVSGPNVGAYVNDGYLRPRRFPPGEDSGVRAFDNVFVTSIKRKLAGRGGPLSVGYEFLLPKVPGIEFEP